MSGVVDVNDLLIRLYLDEDVHESLLPALRQHGYDVVNVREVNRRAISDAEQLTYATGQGRTLFSFNATDCPTPEMPGSGTNTCGYYRCQTVAYRRNFASFIALPESIYQR